jgi:hypothetical protein
MLAAALMRYVLTNGISGGKAESKDNQIDDDVGHLLVSANCNSRYRCCLQSEIRCSVNGQSLVLPPRSRLSSAQPDGLAAAADNLRTSMTRIWGDDTAQVGPAN